MKKEEIREGIAEICYSRHPSFDHARYGELEKIRWADLDDITRQTFYCEADQILFYLHSLGVVIKVDKQLPLSDFYFEDEAYETGQEDMLKAGYVATEPLVELCPQCGVEPHLCKCPTINRGSFAKYVEE